MTSGRQSAMPSAIAREPSICLSMACLSGRCGSGCNGIVGRRCRRDVGFGKLAGKCLADGAGDGMQVHDAGQGGECTKERRIRNGTADMLECKLACRHHPGMAVRKFCGDLGETELMKCFSCVDEEIALRFEPLEDIYRLEQG